MYTQCPECQIAFRVTARVLQQAGGKVRCGSCGNAFSALDHLSEDMPESSPSADAQGDGRDALAETSRKLLETLNELAGPEDVRIEDTGVEWRVLSEADAAKAENSLTDSSDTGSMKFDEGISGSDDEEALPTVHEEPGNAEQPAFIERRYDDNTPLPEDYDDEDSDKYSPPPQRRETDLWQESTKFDELQGDLALSEPGEWTDLLEEVSDANSIPAEVEEELVAIHSQLSSRSNSHADDTAAKIGPVRNTESQSAVPVDIDTQFELQAEALGITGEQKIIDENDERTLQDELTDEMPLLDGEYGAAAENEELADEPVAEQQVADEHIADEPVAVENIELSADDAYADEEDEDEDALEYDLSDEYDNEDEDDEDLALYAAAEANADLQLEDDAAPETQHGENHEDGAQISATGDGDDAIALAKSTGEFEAQIDVAADALKYIDEDRDDAQDTHDADAADTDDDQGSADGEQEQVAVEEDEDEDEDEEILLEEGDAQDLLDDVEQISDTGIDEPVVDLDVADEVDNDVAENRSQAGDDDDVDPVDDEDNKSEKMTDDQLAATVFGVDQASKFFDENSGEVETIIMEGEFIRSALEKERLEEERQAQANIQEASKLADTYAMNREKMRGGRRSYNPPGYVMLIGAALLGIALVAQIVHASRDSLATSDLFNSAVAPVYRLLGRPITPQWDIKGWQFEATSGSTDDDEAALTVVSRIANYADVPLPYPLVHVSLTDRWEEIIGSRVLEPTEYLAGDIDPSMPVTPGEDFTAVIKIDNPSAAATGFKLNVCYRVVPGRVRCAIEDFKD